MEENSPKLNTFKQTALFLILPLAALLLGLWFSRFGVDKPKPPLKVGLVDSDPLSYCAFGLLESGAPNFEVIKFTSYEELLSSFKEASVDSCLIRAKDISKLNADEVHIGAVTSYLNLIAIENGKTISSLADLEAINILLPDTIDGTPELLMLEKLLLNLEIEPAFTFESETMLLERAKSGKFNIMLVPASLSAKVLKENSKYTSAFSLAKQWKRLLSSSPPAGSFFVVRNDYMETGSIRLKSALASIERAISFMASKRKKAAILIAANGFEEYSDYIRKTIPHCMFAFLEGRAMAEPMEQLALLK